MLDKLVTLTLDKERYLRLTLKGMLEFEKLTGRKLLKGFNLKELTLEETAGFLWCCLIHEDRELTLDDVLNMVDLRNLLPMIDAITACVNQSLSGDEEDDTPPLPETSQPG